MSLPLLQYLQFMTRGWCFAPHTEGWVFKSKPRQTEVVKTCSDSSTAEHSVVTVSVTVLGCPVSQYAQEPALVPSIGQI